MRRIVKDAFDAVLKPEGFVRVGQRRTWTRQTTELVHIVTILHRHNQYDIQWGVFSAEAVEVLFGVSADPTDVGQSVMSGTPGTIRHPALGQSWNLTGVDEDALQVLIGSIRDNLQIVQKHLRSFERRIDVRAHLLENRDPMDRRDFLIPASLPLKLLTAATLAVADQDKEACVLIPEVDHELSRFQGPISRQRVVRLHKVAETLCGQSVIGGGQSSPADVEGTSQDCYR